VTRSILTIATGRRPYFEMACSLARSINVTNPTLPTYILTDGMWSLPRGLRNVFVVRLSDSEAFSGFKSKLYLDCFVKTDRVLFIDADSLVVADLAPMFAALQGRAVGVFGVPVTDGEWFGEVSQITTALNLSHLVMLNGGVYYLENSDKMRAILDRKSVV